MRKSSKGFTLIEMLIVIAIIGILAAVAWPFLQNQIVKARLTEVTNGMSNVASAVAAYYEDAANGGAGTWPTCANQAQIQTSLGVSLGALTRVQTMAVDGATGNITATVQQIDPVVNGSTLILSPSIATDSSIQWIWSNTATIQAAYLPKR